MRRDQCWAGRQVIAEATAKLESDHRISEVLQPRPGSTLSQDGATAVLLEVNLRSGKHDAVSSSALNPNDELKLRIETSSDEWPPREGDYVTATVTYSDMRGACTYRLSRSADLRRPNEPDASAAGQVSFLITEPTETRVSP